MEVLADKFDSAVIINALNLPLLVVNNDNIICFANDPCESFFGTSRRRIEGRAVNDLLRFDDDRVNAALLSGERDLSAQDMQIHTVDGIANVDISILTLEDAEKSRLITLSPRFVERSIISDRAAGQQLAMGAPAILGHEIKNPLAGIKGAAQLLARQGGAPAKAMTDLIVTEVDRIARLLDQMQNLGGKHITDPVSTNIHITIERAIRSIRAANPHLPDFAINYDPSLPFALIDPDSMVQILINLLQNAVDALAEKHADTPNATIGITTRYVLAGALRDVETDSKSGSSKKLPIEISISDNGPGVPAHIADELFSPFVTSKRDGQGLGLAIVRKLMQQMNSRVVFERDSTAGISIFRLFLPVAQASSKID
jgi:two-component system, NtrC family, nitrogen regulation sensor histidine kinase GlnL